LRKAKVTCQRIRKINVYIYCTNWITGLTLRWLYVLDYQQVLFDSYGSSLLRTEVVLSLQSIVLLTILSSPVTNALYHNQYRAICLYNTHIGVEHALNHLSAFGFHPFLFFFKLLLLSLEHPFMFYFFWVQNEYTFIAKVQ